MPRRRIPRLRTAEKTPPPYPLGVFPANFVDSVARDIVYLLATKSTPSLEGEEWEEIFARAIGAEWKPSQVGLDDVVLETCAWSAKTIKSSNPWSQQRVRLISGRNSPVYSYGTTEIGPGTDPDSLGADVLGIWNSRVDSLRKYYKHTRTVVLIKSNDLTKLSIFELETRRYDPPLYTWRWNKRGNLEGFLKHTGEHCFTWQPSGSQFTIIAEVPSNRTKLEIHQHKTLDRDQVLDMLGFDSTWYTIHR